MKQILVLTFAACALASAANAAASAVSGSEGNTTISRFCDTSHELTATEQDRLLRFAAVVKQELAHADSGLALVSRSGLDLSRFGIRYSHGALAWRADTGAWSARQLYYACDEGRPRIFDQGLAGFAMGTDDAALGYISLVHIPREDAPTIARALLDTRRVQHLVAGQYAANAYAYSLAYQNCNQWLIEMLAVAWGKLDDGDDLRARAQHWLREEQYAPDRVNVGSRILMLAGYFIPLLNVSDHPAEDRSAMKLQVSLPAPIESFVHKRLPDAERVEICHDEKQVVVHRGWTPMAAGCQAGPGDKVIPMN